MTSPNCGNSEVGKGGFWRTSSPFSQIWERIFKRFLNRGNANYNLSGFPSLITHPNITLISWLFIDLCVPLFIGLLIGASSCRLIILPSHLMWDSVILIPTIKSNNFKYSSRWVESPFKITSLYHLFLNRCLLLLPFLISSFFTCSLIYCTFSTFVHFYVLVGTLLPNIMYCNTLLVSWPFLKIFL